MNSYSPLRYPGGKGKLAQYVSSIIVENNLSGGVYVEPYCGGASVALSLLFEEYMSRVIINDANKSIFAFWYSVLNHTDALCRMIHDTKLTVEEWDRQKKIQKYSNEVDLLDLGFSTFFLNRTNTSGIISGGIIGGRSQNGRWKIDARFNKKNLIKRIEKIAQYRGRITVLNLDACDLIETRLGDLPEKTLVYLDPPYFKKGPELYQNYYKPEDHRRVRDTVATKLHHKWIITYDNVPEIAELYSEYRQRTYSLSYSAAKRRTGSEIMIYCHDLKLPDNN